MARVSDRTKALIQHELSQMPAEALAKCSLCRETLTHMVKSIEAKAGAGTATVTKMLADIINKKALPQDQVTGEALTQRVRQNEGLKMSNRQNKPQTWTCSDCGGTFPMDQEECNCGKNEGELEMPGPSTKAEDRVHPKENIQDIMDELKDNHAKIKQGFQEFVDEFGAIEHIPAFGHLNKEMATRFIKVAYRELAKEYHPDAGGTEEDMKELNLIAMAFRGVMGIR